MYLDNVIKSAQAASMPEITYSEIVEDALHMVEVEGAGQLALLKAEATAHIMGSEAPSDWWAKIKTVARKIFEMLKNLISKVFAFVKTIPTKVGTLITRLLTKWEKLGMKSKIDRIRKKTGVKLRYNTAKDLKDKEFDPIYLNISGFPRHGGNVELALTGWGAATKKAIDDIAKLSKEDNDKLSEDIQKIKEEVIKAQEKFDDTVHEFKNTSYKPFESAGLPATVDDNTLVPDGVVKLIDNGWNLLKNKTIEKQAEKLIRDTENGVRSAASTYRVQMATYERYVKDEDEDGVRNALDAAKALRAMVATNSAVAAKIGSFAYHDALTVAKIVNAAISCCKGGENKGTHEIR